MEEQPTNSTVDDEEKGVIAEPKPTSSRQTAQTKWIFLGVVW